MLFGQLAPNLLLNVDSKIASKVISLRIINVLPHIIHSDQDMSKIGILVKQ